MLLTVFAGCTRQEDNNDKTEEDQNLLLSECRIVYPTDIREDIYPHLLDLQSEISTLTGMMLEITDDFVRPDTDVSELQEIIIGNTSRKESAEVMADIGYYDLAIRSVGNKIVVAAHTKDNLIKAIDSFCEQMLTVSDGQTLVGADVDNISETKGFFDTYGELSEYRIVYPENDKYHLELAKTMAAALKKSYSVELDVVSDGEMPNGYEILLGMTNRAAFADYYRGDKKPDSLHYAICAREGNILILGCTEYTAKIACNRFIADFKDLKYSPRFDIESDLECEYAAYDRKDEYVKRADGTDIRVMSYNMLSAELSPDKPDFEDRAEMVLSTVLNFMPDVVGFQEVSEKGYGIIESYVGDTYAIPLRKTPLGEYSFTGLMYNKNTVKFIEGDNHIYTVGNKRIRIISWGLFEMKATGQRFVAASTHWDIVLEHRPQQAVQMTNYINDLKAKYKCPVITTGDFNTLEGTEYYQSYLEKTGQTDARHTAAVVGYALDTDVIDHITATKADMQALFFKLLDTDFTKKASDHDPIFADYKFKK